MNGRASGGGSRASGTTTQLIVTLVTAAATLVHAALPQSVSAPPVPGLSQGATLAYTYDAILNADFEAVDTRFADARDDVPAWGAVLDAVSLWWQIALDPDDRRHDAEFVRAVETAIGATEEWAAREPRRAEAWFAVGAAYGARAQWRVERKERLAAARDGKRINAALQQALALDPAMHDAKFGLGMYRYYAAIAPAAFRMLRWLLSLPGGDRRAGLQQMIEARDQGTVVRGEADYQLHLIYLWYENRSHDALALIRGLQRRHPRNPLFPLVEARIHEVYFHDAQTSAVVLRALLKRVDADAVNAIDIATRRAHAQLRALDARTKH